MFLRPKELFRLRTTSPSSSFASTAAFRTNELTLGCQFEDGRSVRVLHLSWAEVLHAVRSER